MGKKTTITIWFMVVDIAMGVWLYGKTNQGQSLFIDCHIAVRKAETPIPYGFHLCTCKRYTTLEIFNNLIVEVGLFILLEKFEFVSILFHLFIPSNTESNLVPTSITFNNTDRVFGDCLGIIQVTATFHNWLHLERERFM